MLKVFFLCRRRSDISREQYAERVLAGHAPLALKHHPSMCRYVINLAEGSPDGGPEFDSLPALSFDSLEDYRERLYDSPEGAEIIRKDVEGFLGGADAYATTEHVQKEAPRETPYGERSPGVKWMLLLRRRPELTRAQFAEHWLAQHAPLVRVQFPALRRYVMNVVEARLSETGAEWDGIAELTFASDEAARGTPEARKLVADDTTCFACETLAYPVAEYVQK